MDAFNLSKPLRELRLMARQPGYRFFLAWFLILFRIGLFYLALSLGGTSVLQKISDFLR